MSEYIEYIVPASVIPNVIKGEFCRQNVPRPSRYKQSQYHEIYADTEICDWDTSNFRIGTVSNRLAVAGTTTKNINVEYFFPR